MRIPVFEIPVTRWGCPNCDLEQVTRVAGPHSRFHSCAGLAGLTAPMIQAGTKAKVQVHIREDYIGGEDVQYDADGRPVMSIQTTRDDGNDVAVFAPTAH